MGGERLGVLAARQEAAGVEQHFGVGVEVLVDPVAEPRVAHQGLPLPGFELRDVDVVGRLEELREAVFEHGPLRIGPKKCGRRGRRGHSLRGVSARKILNEGRPRTRLAASGETSTRIFWLSGSTSSTWV